MARDRPKSSAAYAKQLTVSTLNEFICVRGEPKKLRTINVQTSEKIEQLVGGISAPVTIFFICEFFPTIVEPDYYETMLAGVLQICAGRHLVSLSREQN